MEGREFSRIAHSGLLSEPVALFTLTIFKAIKVVVSLITF